MAVLADLASRTAGRTVIDETGLAGRHDFELRWDVRDPNSFAEAIHSQLGLRLSAKRRFIDHLVVDSFDSARSLAGLTIVTGQGRGQLADLGGHALTIGPG